MNLQENEIAKQIDEFEKYMITSCGRVWSVKRNKFLTNYDNGKGYSVIGLHKNGKRKYMLIHRLIAIHFIENPKPDEYHTVDHINHITTDNRIENLRWCNTSQNMMNSSKQQNTSSKYKGVCFHKRDNLWLVQLTINRVTIRLGRHKTEVEAAKAYNQFIIDNKMEEFCILNKV